LFYKSHITETGSGELKATEEKPCFISLSVKDWSKSLCALAFEPADQ
jgi:hypothetical protein